MKTLRSNLKLMVGRMLPGLFQVRGQPARVGSKRIALSFDDGPHPEHTPRLLESLAEAGVKASFFVIGELAERHPELIRRMLDGGHEVANHSHKHFTVRGMSEENYLKDLLHCQRVLNKIAGFELPLVVRPPYGILRRRTTLRLMLMGYRHVLWSKDSDDSSLEEGRSLAAHMAAKPLVDGDIVLLHEDYQRTVDELPAILAALNQRGFSLVRCCDLLGQKPMSSPHRSGVRRASTASMR